MGFFLSVYDLLVINYFSICSFFLFFLFFGNVLCFFTVSKGRNSLLSQNSLKSFLVINIYVFVFLYFLSLTVFLFSDPLFVFFKSYFLPYTGNYYYYPRLTLVSAVSTCFSSLVKVYIDSISLLFIVLLFFLIPVCIILNVYIPFQTYHSKFINTKTYINNPYKEYISFKDILSENPSNTEFQLRKKVFQFSNLKHTDYFVSSKTFMGSLWLSLLGIILFYFFITSDLFIFYILFESSMIPLYFMLGLFGSRVNKIKASYYLFFFTVIGSIFFLVAVLSINFAYGSSDLFWLTAFTFPTKLGNIYWVCIFLPLAVKVPVFPFHVWLPEAHVEASTEGSVLLAGLLLKIGLFGMVRFLIPIFGKASIFFFPFVSMLGLVSIIFISFTIFVQLDIKKIIAYSSIIHMNFAMLGLFSGTTMGVQGAIYLMFTHGIISSGMFLVAGFIYARYHTRIVTYYQGLSNSLPVISVFFFILILGNAGIPGTGGFVGEILVLLGLFQKNVFVAIVSLTAPLFGAIYSIVLFVRMFFGINSSLVVLPAFFKNKSGSENKVSTLEVYLLSSFALLTIQTGIFPSIYLSKICVASFSVFNSLNGTAF